MDRDTVVRLACEVGFGANQRNTLLTKLTMFASKVQNETLERAAKACESRIDPEWPGDAESLQCERCADAIRALKE